MKSSTVRPAKPDVIAAPITDDFSVDCKRGRVIGSQSTSGHLRQGIDVENLISIDNGALRIQPPITPGWARAGVAYGPYPKQAGFAFAVFMLNGHNTSEGNSREESFKARIWRWVRGSETNPIGDRMWRRVRSKQHHSTVRQFYRWMRNHRFRFEKDGHLMENLAIGWFSNAVPKEPTEGHSIVIRALGPENGELCTRSCDRLTPAFRGLQNLQTYYIVLLREQGAAYYAASVDNAKGLAAFPYMRLVGIDPHETPGDSVYAGLYQSALGQVGFRVDTRLYDLQAKVLPDLSKWYGTAQTADALKADERVVLEEGATAEIGGSWHSVKGKLEKTNRGLIASAENSSALIDMPEPAGAIHVVIEAGDRTPGCGLLWRTQDEHNTWGLFLENGHCQIKFRVDGEWSSIATEERFGLQCGASNMVQILDEGHSFSLYLDGRLLCDRWFTDTRLQDASQLGLCLSNSSTAFSQLEAHPRNIPIPSELKLGTPWQPSGTDILVSDNFAGPVQDLSEHRAEDGTQWQRSIGLGQMKLTGEGSLKVNASLAQPNPGRLAYTVAWSNPLFADVSVDISPPGTARHQGEKGRGGLIFWQDPDNYITVSQWLDDSYGGASISSFYHIDGFEEIYDAVWTNVGGRVHWGRQMNYRIAFDGLNFITYIDGEPVLYRSLTDVYPRLSRLSIQRVGLVANWEWGDDTGSVFSRFVAKA